MYAITFPNISPIALTIFGFDIYWYAFSYIIGILFGYFFIKRLNQQVKIIPGIVALDDLAFYSTLGIILGGRIGNTIFYDLEQTILNPIKILMIRQGGMSFHGGIIGLICAIFFFCRKYKINFLSVTDMLSCVAPLGLFFGRIANFINAELYGKITNVPWAIIFPNAGNYPRHPSQLYEAFFEGLLLFIIMLLLFYNTNSRKKPGVLGGFFLLWYGIVRSIIEIFRDQNSAPNYFFEFITMGQLLSIPMILVGIYLIFRKHRIQSL